MIKRDKLSGVFVFACAFFFTGVIFTPESHGSIVSYNAISISSLVVDNNSKTVINSANELDTLNRQIKDYLISGDYERCKPVADMIIQKISDKNVDDKTRSDSYYFVGVFYLREKEYNKSMKFLTLSLELNERRKVFDDRFAKNCYNLGVSYYGLGDLDKYEKYTLKSLEIEKKLYGEENPNLISTYTSLTIAYISLRQYEKAIGYSNIALTIANRNPDKVSPKELSDLYGIYQLLGTAYIRQADFSKGKIYLEKAESFYINNHLDHGDNYINLINSLATTYRALGLVERSDSYFKRGIELASSLSSDDAYSLIYNYANILGKAGKKQKGESLLLSSLSKAKNRFGEESPSYIQVLHNYAVFLREFRIDIKKSLECFEKCLSYLRKNDHDDLMKSPVLTGYALALAKTGEPVKALETVQSLLFPEMEQKPADVSMENPGIESIKIDNNSLLILKTKYSILWDIYRKSRDQNVLIFASNTSELIVSLIEKLRINISEEESRLVLGNRFRDSYINAIRDFDLLYSQTSDRKYLEKAFEYSEKSKVAGLLSSTRELKAVQFNIPKEIADFDIKLQGDLNLINVRIAEEINKKDADTMLINNLKENLLKNTMIRDSLIHIFEKQYPDYYSIKYNTRVATLKEIPGITGKNGNYLNYIVSDTLLYIFVVNRQYQQLLTLPIDSNFFNTIKRFRSLLMMPSPTDDVKMTFENYQSTGYDLYRTLIYPVRQYLISDNLIISPDNILSYLPFETILTSADSGNKNLYQKLAYLMNEYDISYTYSATFMAETLKNHFSFRKKVVAFAPRYSKPIDIQSVLMKRQIDNGILPDLPYARLEAEYVSHITGGKLFENGEATESVYKREAGQYDIIHLAMHTLVNDKDPMYSTLVFSEAKDSTNDGFLKTYEIYGIPLKAKMVVLSSCNSGTGLLYSGEGILSLARGFIYSGSQSVVMSMWAIEDRSGTEIVKTFYKYLKNGYSKSVSLRKARIDYLKNSDQLRSHPYYWSALVVYGNNVPLYNSTELIAVVLTIIVLLIGSLIFYFYKRIHF
jgi:CHAT domain-containing protein/tetratricopeptide (TPR) repeat protein